MAHSLLEHIKEMTVLLPVADPQTSNAQFGPEEDTWTDYDDLDDFDGMSFCPPIDAQGNQLTDWSTFTQTIEVQNVRVNDLATPVADLNSDFYRVTVTITHQQQDILTATWVRCLYAEAE